MSARLSTEDLQPVADLLEKLQNVQRAMRDLHDAQGNPGDGGEFRCAVTQQYQGKDIPVAHTHGLSYWVVLQGLAAMERELLSQLANKEISVESALPMAEGA